MDSISASILIADDIGVVRELHKSMLRNIGFERFIDARNGEEAIELVAAHKFDMALLDIDMPKFSGLEVLRELRESNNDIFVVIVSGAGTVGNVQAALDLGVDGFLVKPYSQHKLNNIVSKFLFRS